MYKVVIGFSGGVDSTFTSHLLREQGYDVYGLFLVTSDAVDPGAALKQAQDLGLPLRVADARAAMEEYVCRPFSEAYLRGETPNPCILCNSNVKFPFLIEYADSIGASYVATGHYARVENGALFKGRPANDQSYMLCRLTREQVSRLILPLGRMEKTEVRAAARDIGLRVADKPDSMEICFIPDHDYADYIERRGHTSPPGNFIYYKGQIVGRHGGIHRYTIGQRRGLGVSTGSRVYVSEIRPETNEVILSDGGELYAKSIHVRDVNWLIEKPEGPFTCAVRVRHSRAKEPLALVSPLPDGGAELVFESPVRAPTAGQSAVFYDEERLLGGGFISRICD